ncbi:hypothetical protein QUB77_30865 [Microcoleus sp. AT9b-C3]
MSLIRLIRHHIPRRSTWQDGKNNRTGSTIDRQCSAMERISPSCCKHERIPRDQIRPNP